MQESTPPSCCWSVAGCCYCCRWLFTSSFSISVLWWWPVLSDDSWACAQSKLLVFRMMSRRSWREDPYFYLNNSNSTPLGHTLPEEDARTGQWTMLQELYWILPLCHIRLFLWWYWWNWSNHPLEFISILGVCSFLWCSTSCPRTSQAQAMGAMGPMKAASHTTWSFVHHNFIEESSILIKGGWTWIDPIRKLIRPHSIYLCYNGIGLICV